MSEDENEYMECHWLFAEPKPKSVIKMEKQLQDIENYVFSHTGLMPSSVVNDLKEILWR